MTTAPCGRAPERQRTATAWAVLFIFFRLGVTCFGGPIAHIGYFRNEFVVQRRWLDERAYADLVGLCQFLPGPVSSQVGFSIGLMRAGYLGGVAAWTGFTLPSAFALVLFAYSASALVGPIGLGLLHGLKLVAVAIVAQAVWGMARTLCPDRGRASIAVVAALIILFVTSPFAQIGAIAIGGIVGLWFCRALPTSDMSPCPYRAVSGRLRFWPLWCCSSLSLFSAAMARLGDFHCSMPFTGLAHSCLAALMWYYHCSMKPL